MDEKIKNFNFFFFWFDFSYVKIERKLLKFVPKYFRGLWIWCQTFAALMWNFLQQQRIYSNDVSKSKWIRSSRQNTAQVEDFEIGILFNTLLLRDTSLYTLQFKNPPLENWRKLFEIRSIIFLEDWEFGTQC